VEDEQDAARLDSIFEGEIHAQPGYEEVWLDRVPLAKRAAWLSIGARNGAAYTVLPTVGGMMAVGIWFYRWMATLDDKCKGNCKVAMWQGCTGLWPAVWVTAFVSIHCLSVGLVASLWIVLEMEQAGRRDVRRGRHERGGQEELESELAWLQERAWQQKAAIMMLSLNYIVTASRTRLLHHSIT